MHIIVLLLHMDTVPRTQSQLIRLARGDLTQAEFAQALGVDRTCLSRYERERLGAPPSVINRCLDTLARRLESLPIRTEGVAEALDRARAVVATLEKIDAAGRAPGDTVQLR